MVREPSCPTVTGPLKGYAYPVPEMSIVSEFPEELTVPVSLVTKHPLVSCALPLELIPRYMLS